MNKIYSLEELSSSLRTLANLRDTHFDAWTARDRRVFLESIRAVSRQTNAYVDEMDRIYCVSELAAVEDKALEEDIQLWEEEYEKVITREE